MNGSQASSRRALIRLPCVRAALAARGARGPTAGQLRDAFVAANPGLPRDAVYVAVASGNRLREVRLCHDTAFHPTPCPDGLGAPDRVVLTVEPVGS